MKIEQSLKITSASDNCVIDRTTQGKIHIGSITISDAEADDFCRLLAEALKRLPDKTLDGKPIGPAK